MADTTAVATRAVPVDRYTYHLFSSRDEDAAVIFLYDEHSTAVGEVRFVPDDAPLPPAAERRGQVALYYRRSQLPLVLDLLRNEGPIRLRWDGPINSSLSTGFEPVGEGETGG